MREKIYNIPNLLSFYRLISAPILIGLVFSGNQPLYLSLLTLSIITDMIDGPIARITNTQTKFGARLDSLADGAMYFVVAAGIAGFKWVEMSGHSLWILAWSIAFILPYLLSLIKFRKLPSLHLYSSKVGGVLDGIFVAHLFFFGFNSLLFISAVVWGIFSFAEMTAVLILSDQLLSDCKGIFYVLSTQNITRLSDAK